jgi:hypothetical protein
MENGAPPPPAPAPCDVVQGPSLLRTPLSRPQPSLLFLPGLRSLPYWTSDDDSRMPLQEGPAGRRRVAYNDPTVTHVVRHLESHAAAIRDEFLRVSPTQSDYQTNGHGGGDTSLHHGRWDWQSYMSKGNVQGRFVETFPVTSAVLNELRTDHLLFEGTPFGFAFFSTLHPQSRIDAHAAPMNLRLRVHLPLVVPPDEEETYDTGGAEDGGTTEGTPPASSSSSSSGRRRPLCGMEVGTHHPPRRWRVGSAVVFDDSYLHRVWNDTADQRRVVLLVDVWHPDIAHVEKEAIVGMFQQAKTDGLWKR